MLQQVYIHPPIRDASLLQLLTYSVHDPSLSSDSRQLKRFCFRIEPCVFSTLELFLLMCYINLRFTYLRTCLLSYLLTYLLNFLTYLLTCRCNCVSRGARGDSGSRPRDRRWVTSTCCQSTGVLSAAVATWRPIRYTLCQCFTVNITNLFTFLFFYLTEVNAHECITCYCV